MFLLNTNTTALNAELFAPLSGEKLIHFFILDPLKSTELLVESLAFRDCANLKFLMFYGNRVSSIALDAFVGLHKLEVLGLVDNGLDMLHPEWFQDLHNLQKIGFVKNKVKKIPDGAFRHLTNLKALSLNGNQIATISKKTFEANEQLLEAVNLNSFYPIIG